MSATLDLEAIACLLCSAPDAIELNLEAAAKARTVTADVTVGDPADVALAPASFDLGAAFHVVEHLPDPVWVVRNMLRWLAPGGVLVIEVPNVGGWGVVMFGRHWAARDSRLGAGVVTLGLEVALRAVGPARRGEVPRGLLRHAGERTRCAS